MMINHPRHYRTLKRCEEIAAEPNAPAAVKQVFNDLLRAPARDYLRLFDAYLDAESAWRKEHAQAAAVLEALDPIYRTARSMVAAYLPSEVLPDTLKVASTDTDKVTAVEALLHVLESRTADTWAHDLLTGDFGTKAPAVINELNASIAASKSLSAARDARANAYGLSYERYLAFKRVVRDAFGDKSNEYHRIHTRTRSEHGEQAPSPVAPATAGAPPA